MSSSLQLGRNEIGSSAIELNFTTKDAIKALRKMNGEVGAVERDDARIFFGYLDVSDTGDIFVSSGVAGHPALVTREEIVAVTLY